MFYNFSTWKELNEISGSPIKPQILDQRHHELGNPKYSMYRIKIKDRIYSVVIMLLVHPDGEKCSLKIDFTVEIEPGKISNDPTGDNIMIEVMKNVFGTVGVWASAQNPNLLISVILISSKMEKEGDMRRSKIYEYFLRKILEKMGSEIREIVDITKDSKGPVFSSDDLHLFLKYRIEPIKMSDFAEKIEKMMSEASLENSSSKFLVEYEDYNSETSDLLDVLSGIGLAEKNRVVCKVFVMTPITGIHPYDWPEWGIGVVVTEFYEELTREKFLDKTFQKILKGEFEQQTPDNIEFVYSKSPELKKILSKPNIVERAKKIESSPLPPTGKTSKIDKLFMGLVSEVLDLMKKLIDKRARMLDDEYEKTLDENMGYSIQIDKI